VSGVGKSVVGEIGQKKCVVMGNVMRVGCKTELLRTKGRDG